MATSQNRQWNTYKPGAFYCRLAGLKAERIGSSLTSPDFESVEATNEIFAVVMF